MNLNLPKQPQTNTNNPALSFRRYAHVIDPLLTKPKNRAYTTTILSFLVISLFLWYAIRPTVQTILELRREIRDDTDVNQQMESKISSLVEAQAVYQDSSNRLPLLPQALPKNPEMVALLLSLQNIAASANATISGVEVNAVPLEISEATGPGKPLPTDVVSNPVTISVEGKYADIKNFLDSLMNMRRIVTVKDYSIIQIGDNNGAQAANPPLRLVIRLLANYYPEAPYER